MRGAYYITAALLIVASSRTAAEYGQLEQLQTNDHDVMEAVYAVTTTRPQRFLRESGDVRHDSDPTTADDERMDRSELTKTVSKTSTKAFLWSIIRGVLGIQTPETKAVEEVEFELQTLRPNSAASSSKTYTLEWGEWSIKSSEEWSEVTPEEWNELIKLQKNVAGQISFTLRRHHHWMMKKQISSMLNSMSNVPSEYIRTEVDIEWIEFSPEEWVTKMNQLHLEIQKELVIRDDVYAAEEPGTSSHLEHLYSDSLEHKAIHDAFLEVINPSHFFLTKEDYDLLRSMMGWEGSDSEKIKFAKEQLRLQAFDIVAKRMVFQLIFKSHRKSWNYFTEARKFDSLTIMLNDRYEILMWVFEIAILNRPDIHAGKVATKDRLKDFGKSS